MKTYGYLLDPWDPRDVWVDEIVGSDASIPESYKIGGLTFEPQRDYPFCAAMSVTKMLEWQYREAGANFEFSKPHLFFQSGGGPMGSYFRANLETAKSKGCIDEEKLPLPNKENTPENFEHYRKTALAIPFENTKNAGGYARVSVQPDDLKRAILNHGPIMVGVYAGGGWWNPNTRRQGETDNHACLLVGWDKYHWIMFDSLQPYEGFSGYHTVASDYTFQSAFAIVDLPPDWKQKVEEGRKTKNIDRYGKPRVFQAEIDNGYLIKNALERFVARPVMDYAGPRWEEYIRAATYGGWSITDSHPIFKWRKVPGDIVRESEHWFLTREHLFDFDKPKS